MASQISALNGTFVLGGKICLILPNSPIRIKNLLQESYICHIRLHENKGIINTSTSSSYNKRLDKPFAQRY
jgi:hypothetical protein